MNGTLKSIRNWHVGTKITFFSFCLTSLILAALIFVISITTGKLLKDRADSSIVGELQGVSNTVEVFNSAVTNEANSFANMLSGSFAGKFSLDGHNLAEIGGKKYPVLMNGNTAMNLNFDIPDRFTALTGATATIFVADGEDFVRVSTSVKKENGERAVGTVLDHAHAGYALLRSGQPYAGLARLFGKQYITHYGPIKDDGGRVIGVLYVGIDLTKDLLTLKEKIKHIKAGESGSFYVINAAPGKEYGTLIIDRKKEGTNVLDSKDAGGHEFIREMLDRKNGSIVYPVASGTGTTTQTRNKVIHYVYFNDWNWLIAGGTFENEITQEAADMRNRYVGLGAIALVLFAVLLFLLVRTIVTRPLHHAHHIANQIAAGDLTATVTVTSNDEIGQLLTAMNGTASNLSQIVGEVRLGTDHIVEATTEIALGNQDLAARTQAQANALHQIATAIEILTDTIKDTAQNAEHANQLTTASSLVAGKSGDMMRQVVDTMNLINESTKTMSGIVTVIDGIAFQTNILALNAAVEAAHAGEKGRGFSVVATEVRNLAHRCAASAKEIKNLIELSLTRVETGSRLIGDAGATIHEVQVSINNVRNIMGDIASASKEQSQNIAQINQAINEMDGTTQQNAALVEQAAEATSSLQDQATILAQQVSAFRLAEVQEFDRPASNQSAFELQSESPQLNYRGSERRFKPSRYT